MMSIDSDFEFESESAGKGVGRLGRDGFLYIYLAMADWNIYPRRNDPFMGELDGVLAGPGTQLSACSFCLDLILGHSGKSCHIIRHINKPP